MNYKKNQKCFFVSSWKREVGTTEAASAMEFIKFDINWANFLKIFQHILVKIEIFITNTAFHRIFPTE